MKATFLVEFEIYFLFCFAFPNLGYSLSPELLALFFSDPLFSLYAKDKFAEKGEMNWNEQNLHNILKNILPF